jgi:hypothetical protein
VCHGWCAGVLASDSQTFHVDAPTAPSSSPGRPASAPATRAHGHSGALGSSKSDAGGATGNRAADAPPPYRPPFKHVSAVRVTGLSARQEPAWVCAGLRMDPCVCAHVHTFGYVYVVRVGGGARGR